MQNLQTLHKSLECSDVGTITDLFNTVNPETSLDFVLHEIISKIDLHDYELKCIEDAFQHVFICRKLENYVKTRKDRFFNLTCDEAIIKYSGSDNTADFIIIFLNMNTVQIVTLKNNDMNHQTTILHIGTESIESFLDSKIETIIQNDISRKFAKFNCGHCSETVQGYEKLQEHFKNKHPTEN